MTPDEIRALTPHHVHRVLGKHILLDGYPFVLDLDASHGSWLVDALTGTAYLDFCSFFSSCPLGINPPEMTNDEEFLGHLSAASIVKLANSDIYSLEFARFVGTFERVLGDRALPHLFFIEGGALAVENALKAAFDWKAQQLSDVDPDPPDLSVLHLQGAFHGRSGYTLSLTNTDPNKTALFPKFAWPRIPAPVGKLGVERSLSLARQAFEASRGRIACFIAEPIQCEGGDNHLDADYLLSMQELTHEYDALFIIDEVQTCCATGGPWAYRALGLAPDVVAFGKKAQVCGIMAGRRIDHVPENVFVKPSRINSTWGGSLVDMVRARRILEIVEEKELFAHSRRIGAQLVTALNRLAYKYPRVITNPRGSGVLCAVDAQNLQFRNEVLDKLLSLHHIIALPAGRDTIRFRPSLTVSESEVETLVAALDQVLSTVT